jgi:large subunit ribosomal protein L5
MSEFLSKDLFNKNIVPKVKESLNLKNIMQTPRLKSIVVSGCYPDSNDLKKAEEEIFLITGMKPVITKAKKSVAAFKLRENTPIGVKVTLRGNAMYQFVSKLLFSLPYIKNFMGFSSKQFDSNGNFSFGIEEQVIFKEIDYDKVDKIRGMNITICVDCESSEHSKVLLSEIGFPFYN